MDFLVYEVSDGKGARSLILSVFVGYLLGVLGTSNDGVRNGLGGG